MALKTIHARAPKSSDEVELLVLKARQQAGVERILVVYEAQAAHIYVEGEPVKHQRLNGDRLN